MEVADIITTTVYNNPAFAQFISEYFNKAHFTIRIMNEQRLLVELQWVYYNRQLVSLPFASAMGLMELTPLVPVHLMFSFMNACINSLQDQQVVELQFSEIMNSIRRKDFGQPLMKWHLRSFTPASLFLNTDKCLSYLTLNGKSTDIFSSFSSNLRRKIRKAGRNGIRVKAGGEELVKDFYEVYAANCTRLGSPVLNQNFYSGMSEAYGDKASRFFVAYIEDKAVGVSLMLYYNRQWECIYLATLEQYNLYYTSYLLIWEMINYAAGKQADIFSFGRSDKGSGVHQFKQQWGTVDLPLYWSSSCPERINIRKFKRMTHFWPFLPRMFRAKAGHQIAKRIY